MAYTKTTWTDRAVQYPQRFTRTSDGTYDTLVPAPGTITQSGTPITATALNKLETQYDEAIATVGAINKLVPSLLNGWQKNYQCHYWRDADNTVHYNFAIMNGATGINSTFLIFPAGYRPEETEMHVGFANGSNFITSISTLGYFQNLVAIPSASNVVLRGSFKATQ